MEFKYQASGFYPLSITVTYSEVEAELERKESLRAQIPVDPLVEYRRALVMGDAEPLRMGSWMVRALPPEKRDEIRRYLVKDELAWAGRELEKKAKRSRRKNLGSRSA